MVLSTTMSASLAEARAAKDSLWFVVDPGAIARADGKDRAAWASYLLFAALGYGDKNVRLRLSLTSK
jgi:hypothetical protein